MGTSLKSLRRLVTVVRSNVILLFLLRRLLKTCRLSRSQQPFHLQNTTSRIKFVLEDYRYYTGYSVDYQIKLFDYICYREKKGIDQTYGIIQSISYINAADGEVR